MDKHLMSPLAAFLAQYQPGTEEIVYWDTLRLHVTSYLCAELPPLAFVTSVRAVVLKDSSVMVVRDPDSTHILPGGRREPDEALIDTLTREVLEETGWAIDEPRLLGIKHFHHLTSIPPKYRYPYPDFLQVVYCARARHYFPDAREVDGYELETKFMPIEEALQMPLAPNDRLWLQSALLVIVPQSLSS
jgi:8-oxo-dGTP pyrophosphatase MutT (NUDIX family)